ncbi:peptide chain release factor N(5)-glutamine methyltransferase [Corynebacterium sanguinis]|uniref:peptide chain release factor N(5)-glutamine methyltransferase n=1 Tax=Corynebacterium sanguinis TaxID=2594913 RepID=UPI0021AFD978|nr:peptide chain release factor N(5)-glutamine methyltransferase [Corynebacterium sanguinis]MCT1464324.1 peptide chain release factor N(5)-glutamine methyltransferase [Corynebacterium sanguinis]MCT1664246.1 peptide chain release factor N(5)-glutamine methyltransferase [Corynebacterium sanguinis]MCT2252447.1 peptide chain release factor N(5)-glutamine methyltransferase [Corynebacterium sanguinis]MCT2328686.1 peptide chain release factor N(5)-glutamine methyltransferase [Corynebacterium sanguinis
MRQSKTRELVARGAHMLRAAGVDTPEVDARLLAAWLLDVAPLAVNSTEPAPNFQVRFAEAIRRRAAREPLQHITGRAPFGPLELAVGPGVFIPRPETEILADWAVRRLTGASAPVVVDLGTGSGALAIYIAHTRDDARVTAVEASATARRYARANAERLGVNVDVVAGDMTDPALLSELEGRVDLVVSNPPYVPHGPDVGAEVHHDPYEAVFSGADGMDAIRGLVPVAARLLAPGGALGIEHDDTTSQLVQDVLAASGAFSDVEPLDDLTGRARFVTASKVKR